MMERIAIISKIRLIISDIDGTILTSNHQVDDQLIEVMPELEKAKIPFVLAFCPFSTRNATNCS